MILAAKHQPDNQARSGNADAGHDEPEYEVGRGGLHARESST
jgi:hypothetical protein